METKQFDRAAAVLTRVTKLRRTTPPLGICSVRGTSRREKPPTQWLRSKNR